MAFAVDCVVAIDGSGNYPTIGAAVAAAPRNSTVRFVIRVKEGMYSEYVTIGVDVWNLTLVGDGMERTVISGNRSAGSGFTTRDSATVTVYGQGFIARDLTMENTAGAINKQAVALLSFSDNSAIWRCAIKGYQDTLSANAGKQFYRECTITGTVDFVFGNAAAVFQRCWIVARKPLKGQPNVITAQGRDVEAAPAGFSFLFCEVLADSELVHAGFAVQTFLGRPWRSNSRVVFLKCNLTGLIDPKGWLQWEGKTDVDDMYYGEYNNSGPGADVTDRVKWPGFHVLQDLSEAAKFTVKNFINGDQWIPATGVEFTPGLDQ